MLRPYQIAVLQGFARGQNLNLESYANLRDMIVYVAEVEGPVHINLVIERIRVHYGLGRVRSTTRRSVLYAVARAAFQGDINLEGHFVWLIEEQKNQTMRQAGPRWIGEIYELELERIISSTMEARQGLSDEEIIRYTALNMGYKRTGHMLKLHIRNRLENLRNTN